MIWYCLITHFFGRVSALGLEPTLDGCSRTLAQLYGPWDLQDHFPLDQKNRCQNHQSPTPWKKHWWILIFVASNGRFAAGHPLVSSDGSGAGGGSLSAGSQPGPSSPGGGVPGDLRERDGAGEKWSVWAELAQLVKGVRNLMIIVGMIGIEEELNIY